MNYKRRKPRRKVACQVCTPYRNGNARSNKPARDLRALQSEVHRKARP